MRADTDVAALALPPRVIKLADLHRELPAGTAMADLVLRQREIMERVEQHKTRSAESFE